MDRFEFEEEFEDYVREQVAYSLGQSHNPEYFEKEITDKVDSLTIFEILGYYYEFTTEINK